MPHDCNKEREIDLMWEDIKEVKDDVKDILKFKWQIIGIYSTIVAACAIAVELFASMLRH